MYACSYIPKLNMMLYNNLALNFNLIVAALFFLSHAGIVTLIVCVSTARVFAASAITFPFSIQITLNVETIRTENGKIDRE